MSNNSHVQCAFDAGQSYQRCASNYAIHTMSVCDLLVSLHVDDVVKNSLIQQCIAHVLESRRSGFCLDAVQTCRRVPATLRARNTAKQ